MTEKAQKKDVLFCQMPDFFFSAKKNLLIKGIKIIWQNAVFKS